MIRLRNVAYEIGERVLFKDLDLNINQFDRIGLVGPNGSGKTTVLKIIKGEVQPTYGEIERARAIEIGYLPQEAIFNRGRTLLDEVLNDYNLAINQLRAQEKTMSDKSHQSDEQLRHYGELQHKFDALGGWGPQTEGAQDRGWSRF